MTEQTNVDTFSQEIIQKLINATKYANELPQEEDFNYFSTFKTFKSKMNELGERILHLTQNLIDREEPEENPHLTELEDVDEVIDRFRVVVDVVDGIIERVDSFADESHGENKTNIIISKTKVANPSGGAKPGSDYYMFYGSNILRPQTKFEDRIDNSPTPFVPKIKAKPNALKPLELKMEGEEEEEKSNLPKDVVSHLTSNLGLQIHPGNSFDPTSRGYNHPYEYELMNFSYSEFQLQPTEPQMYSDVNETKCTWIDTPEGLQALETKLESVYEFAVDLEQHSYRTYQGFVCLMQISTRTEDFLIDTLALRSHMQILAPSFTNPKIVKILHGSDLDIIWLQRDFGLYIVNLFDTGQASRVLEFPSYSLAYLLKSLCGVTADKKYQLADWRIRPLPEEMQQYAKEDTHYLIYIYDVLKNHLIAKGNESKNLLFAVLNRSRSICLKRYEKETITPYSHMILYNKQNVMFNAQQMKIFQALFLWRDQVAREEDESTRYVLPNQILFHVAELMPTTADELFSCCSGTVPPLLRLYADDVVALIAKSKQEAANPPPLPLPNIPTTPTHKFFQDPLEEKKIGQTLSTPLQPTTSLKNGSSPVLSTEQLYLMAGWVDNGLSNSGQISESKVKTIFSAVNEGFKCAGTPSLALDEDSDEDEEDVEAKKTVAKILSSIQNPFSFAYDQMKEITEAQQKLLKKEAEEVPLKSASSAEETEEVDTSVPHSMAEIYQLSNKNKKRNKDKKKNKEGTNGTTSAFDADGNEQSDEESSSMNSKRQKATDPKTQKDTDDFMKTIGWVEEGTKAQASSMPPPPPPSSSPPQTPSPSPSPSPPPSPSNSSHKSASQSNPSLSKTSKSTPTVGSFDYSAAPNPFGKAPQSKNHPQQNVFNPYSSVQTPGYGKQQKKQNFNPKGGPKSQYFSEEKKK